MTDNKDLLTRVETSLPYIEPFPNIMLISDWDITHEIVHSLRQLQTPPTLNHVKGHQDNLLPYCAVPLDAQLNVDADAAATKFQHSYGSRR